ncbi:MAG: CPBP family intramembrane metalloprotease [Candidatus Marsarchaeota archaeon]|nr:CPBP family intramembrane metalloprotease [Candidatus Marsarchaeota archaeon]
MFSSLVFISIFIAVLFILTEASSAIANFVNAPSSQLLFFQTAGQGLSFFVAPIVYLFLYKKMRIAELFNYLGFGVKSFKPMLIGIGLIIFAIVMMISLVSTVIGSITSKEISTNTNELFNNAPLWFFVFAAVLEPIFEETLFRGIMIKSMSKLPLKLGIFVSAFLFAMGHLAYNSTFEIEVIAAFIFGVIAGYVFDQTDSLYPSITAHILVNTIGVAALLIIPLFI